MSKAKEIKAYLYDMENTKRELAEKLAQISGDSVHSESYKAEARAKAIEEVSLRLKAIAEKAEASLPDWKQLAEKQNAFSYDDPKLLAAVQFIKLEGKSLPESAWKTMIADFHDKPAVLTYLADTMERCELIDGAISAKEAAQQIAFNTNLPQRIADGIYYAAESDPTAHIDMSGLVNELDGLEAFETVSESEGEE